MKDLCGDECTENVIDLDSYQCQYYPSCDNWTTVLPDA